MPAILSDQEVLIALGSNLECDGRTPAQNLSLAIGALQDAGLQHPKISRFFATPCFPKGAGPDFVNAAVVFRSSQSALGLLNLLHEIEADLGRVRDRRWGARAVDLDLIGIGSEIEPDISVFETWRGLPLDEQMRVAPDRLILPHPRLQDRAFVLVPLCDVAPDWVHPVLGMTVRQMRDALPKKALDEVVPL